MDRPKIKKFSEKICFFSNFLNIFQFFINLNAYFWKFTPNFRALPNSKISFHPRKIGPPAFNRKILHKLLTVFILMSWFHITFGYFSYPSTDTLKIGSFRFFLILGIPKSFLILIYCLIGQNFDRNPSEKYILPIFRKAFLLAS